MTIATLSTSVQQCINNFAAALTRNKTLILQCLAFTFIWGLIAHGFMFANNILSWDSLGQMVEGTYPDYPKVRVGKVLVPVYNYLIKGFITIPWMVGLLSLLFIGLASFLIAKLFSLRSIFSLILLTGILTVNVTVIAINGTYISDIDANMFAMLCSVIAAYWWRKYKYGFLWGSLPLAFSLGIYQSYISVTIVLVIFISILDLLQMRFAKDVFLNGLRAIAMLLIAGILYFIAFKVIYAVFDIELYSTYNSIDAGLKMTPQMLIEVILQTYVDTIHDLLYVPSVYRFGLTKRLHIVLLSIPLIIITRQMFNKNLNIWNKILVIALIAILPWGMNICKVISGGHCHDIMRYAFWLDYLLVVLIIKWNCDNRILTQWGFDYWSKLICGALLFIILLWNVRLANSAYFIKSLEDKATFSLLTRVSADIDRQPGYVLGETEIAFIGEPRHLFIDFPHRSRSLHGMWYHANFMHERCGDYLRNFLMSRAVFVTGEDKITELKELEEVKSMPFYPAEGSIQMIGDILVVKLGEINIER